MTAANYRACLAEVLRHEGGFTDDRRDPGNWTSGKIGVGELRGTNMGIAAHAHPREDIRGMTRERAGEIYRAKYWRPVQGDELPPGVDLVTFDAAVNSGPGRGIRWLQQALGVRVTERMDAATLVVVVQLIDGAGVIQRACAARMGFLGGLDIWKTYGRGWSKRVARAEAVGTRMWLASREQPAAGRMAETAERADKTAKAQNTAAGATAGSGAAGGAGGAQLEAMPPEAVLVFVALAALVAFLLWLKSRHNRNRGAAFRAAALEK